MGFKRQLRESPDAQAKVVELVELHKELLQEDTEQDYAFTLGRSRQLELDEAPGLTSLVVKVARERADDLSPAFMCEIGKRLGTKELLQAFAESIVRRRNIYRFSPTMLANLSLNLARERVVNEDLMDGIADTFIRKLDMSTPYSMTSLVHAFVRLGERHERLIREISLVATENIGMFDGGDLARLSWVYANLDFKDEALLGLLAKAGSWILPTLTPSQINVMVWSLAKTGVLQKDFLLRAAEVTADTVDRLSQRDVANMVWAYARLNVFHERMMQAISNRSMELLDKFPPISMKNLVWGFATLGYRDVVLVEALSMRAIKVMHKFNPQEVSNFVWGLGTLEIKCTPALEAFADFVVKRVERFTAQGLFNVAWGFAKLEVRNAPLLRSIARRAQQVMNTFRPQGVANLAYAYGSLGWRDEELGEALSARAIPLLQQFKPQELCNMLYGLSGVNLLRKELMDAVVPVVVQKAAEFNDFDWSTIIQSSLKCGVHSVDLLRACANTLPLREGMGEDTSMSLNVMVRLKDELSPEEMGTGLQVKIKAAAKALELRKKRMVKEAAEEAAKEAKEDEELEKEEVAVGS